MIIMCICENNAYLLATMDQDADSVPVMTLNCLGHNNAYSQWCIFAIMCIRKYALLQIHIIENTHYSEYALLRICIILTQTVHLRELSTLHSVSELWTLSLKTESTFRELSTLHSVSELWTLSLKTEFECISYQKHESFGWNLMRIS